MRILVASVLLLLFAACNRTNENYCPDEMDNHCKYRVDAAKMCTASMEGCVCLMPENICVECTVEDKRNCTEQTKPACGEDHRCRECRSNDECGAGACLEDGRCSSEAAVLYAAPNGMENATCGTAPAEACSIKQALTNAGGTRTIIRLAPGTYNLMEPDGLNITKSTTLAALGATITRTGGTGPLVTVRPSQTLTLIGGTLRGLTASDGIRCDGGAVRAHKSTFESLSESAIDSNSCELTVARSTIRNNLLGGINMTGVAKAATITNNFVYRNGGQASPVGGMILRLQHPGSKVEFNTVVDNTSEISGGSAGGIACEGQGYDAPFNLVYRNIGGFDGKIQFVGTCTSNGTYKSDAPPGDNRLFFENPAGANPSYRLTEMSPVITIRDSIDCRDQVDFEGDARPQPDNSKCDFGADEYRKGQ